MNSATQITIPLLNPNEPEALLSGLFITNGQKVSEGDLLCTLETTKSIADINAEHDGYIIGLRLNQGSSVNAGELLCYIADNSDWQPPSETPPLRTSSQEQETLTEDSPQPEKLRITQPALALAQEAGLDLNLLPFDQLVTENLLRTLMQDQASLSNHNESTFDPTAIIIYGGGGHGKALIDLIQTLESYRIIGIIDDGISTSEKIMGYPVLGGSDTLIELYQSGTRLAVNAVGGIGNLATRLKVFQKLAAAGFSCPAVIHPTAFLEASASISPGVQVFPHAYVGSEAHLGYGCIVNTSAVVSHDCSLGDYTNISPGAILAGEVHIGSSVLIGMGVTVNLSVKIGDKARIGNAATIKQDVPKGAIVRAGAIWPD